MKNMILLRINVEVPFMEIVSVVIIIAIVLFINLKTKWFNTPSSNQVNFEISPRELETFFRKYSGYYMGLSIDEKKIFVERAQKFLQVIVFEGRRGLKINSDIKMFVIDAFVQITFGLKNFVLPKFQRVIVYPDSYYNQLTGRMHKGEVNPRGAIVFSIKSLLNGYANPNDSINLGLHELAHALFYSLTNDKGKQPELEQSTKKFTLLALKEIENINSNKTHIFRKYATTNVSEFFAVAVENFFESPQAFKHSLPHVYQSLSELLNQDPANKIWCIKPLDTN